jgi:ATP-dependent Clp protease adaptor protein ClpS
VSGVRARAGAGGPGGGTATATRPRPETREKERTAPPWNVVVHDDPVNLMSWVTLVFQRVFGYPRPRAEQLMMEVHTRGRSIVWTGDFERAEGYLRELHGCQLLATLERTE